MRKADTHHTVKRARSHLRQIKQAFPEVSIETCARVVAAPISAFSSTTRGGPLIRTCPRSASAQRGFQNLFPSELMGSHVEPSPCHITGRQHSMAFRAGVAFWGHRRRSRRSALSAADHQVLSEAIALHKHHRELIHAGTYQVVDRPGQQAWMASPDHSEALAALAILETRLRRSPTSTDLTNALLRLTGLARRFASPANKPQTRPTRSGAATGSCRSAYRSPFFSRSHY